MKTLPQEVLQRLASLPEGKPCRVILNTNGLGEWKTEITIFEGTCTSGAVIVLQDFLPHLEED